MPETPIDRDGFREVLGRFATGVTIVTARLGDEIGGMTVSAFSSVALDPPLVLVCLTMDKPTAKLVAESGRYAVNILSADQEETSNAFAFKDLEDRFDGVAWRYGRGGLPLLDGTLAGIECTVVQTHQAGDHLIFVGRVETAHIADGDPILYTQHRYRRLAP